MSEGKKLGIPFAPETAPRQGRQAGTRNRLNARFLDDLREVWEQHGKAALLITAKEQPTQFAKIVASILPREIELTDNTGLSELTDEQIDVLTEILRRSIGGASSTRSREEPPALN